MADGEGRAGSGIGECEVTPTRTHGSRSDSGTRGGETAEAGADPVNVAAFKEAYKNLLNMRERVLQPRNPTP